MLYTESKGLKININKTETMVRAKTNETLTFFQASRNIEITRILVDTSNEH